MSSWMLRSSVWLSISLEAAVRHLRARSGRAHDPNLVDAFCRHATGILAGLEEATWGQVLEAEPGQRQEVSEPEIDTALEAIADFADLKSPYFAGHSRGVSQLAASAASRCGLPAADVAALRRAGLVHDIGRVGVSSGAWGKPGALTESEWERVRMHPYFTERVLSRAPNLAAYGAIASMHHERLDASGYHRGLSASNQPVAARILAAADVYQALTEPRPQRLAHPPQTAAITMRSEVAAGRLDSRAVEAVLSAAGHRSKSHRAQWPAGLSTREVEVLRLVARGLSNREMGGRLHLSPRTVHHHVQHIYDKVGVATRAAATLFAMQHGLLEPNAEPERK